MGDGMINFTSCLRALDAIEVKTLQKYTKYKFPNKYINTIAECDYGCPQDQRVIFFDNTLKKIDMKFLGRFLSASQNNYETETIWEELSNPPEFFPEKIIAFAVDPFGNYFCFDYRQDPKTDNPPVVFWNHEGAGTEQAISFLAKDLDAFLGMFKSEEEAEAEYQRLKAEHKSD